VRKLREQLMAEELNILSFECLPSTNAYLKELRSKASLKSGTVIMADYQEAGRGQRGKTWLSENGQGLLFSLYYKPYKQSVEDQFILIKWISVAIVNVLKDSFGLSDACVKWPNDIYVGRKKLGGILIENSIQGEYIQNSIIGIGLNVFQQSFDESLPSAVSLFQLLGESVDLNRKSILIQVIESFYEQVNKEKELVHRAYLKHLMLRGIKALYKIHGKCQNATLLGVHSNGSLELLIEDQKQLFFHGEIEFLL